MKNAINLITTTAAVVILALCWGMLTGLLGLHPLFGAVGGFFIGIFGQRVIYKWLGKPDTQSASDLESE